jgi:hypothetical protein
VNVAERKLALRLTIHCQMFALSSIIVGVDVKRKILKMYG